MKPLLAALPPHEKKRVLTGLAIVALIILAWMAQLLSGQVNQLKQTVKQNQSLLLWMQDADNQLRQPGHAASAKTDLRPAVIQTALEAAQMTTHVTKLRQNEKGAVLLTLTEVNFDSLLKLLDAIQKKTGAVPIQIHIKRGAATGSVSADMLLQAE